ncbi:hypothetical protein SH601_04565 [Gracilibacillus sp. S3-1-1]|uniref:Uncharacterized protein n=1 Tax=Gracilibacillus pellucidus TaxID=3095368 RepID=A0ACC6M2R7_9BACI|nr:hypothetical protein [Gracilibacillus sp. S3-1-1]MDX8045255.1 hypothetical protein [Gracilibacillus sp. S3-1-1]
MINNIDFDANKEAPYFQVSTEQRIRWGMERLSVSLIQQIVADTFGEEDAIHVTFLSEYITNKRYSTKTNIGKIIKIRNWKETVVKDKTIGESAIYATVKNINRHDVSRYCSAVYLGHREAYIAFYLDDILLYVSSDVIDIIATNVQKIARLKQMYVDYDVMYC